VQDSTYTLNSLQTIMGFGKDGIANAPAASVKKGVCVECKTECDCDVNHYCGNNACTRSWRWPRGTETNQRPGTARDHAALRTCAGTHADLVIPNGVKSENTGTGATDYAKQIMAAYGMAFSGMKLRGKCIDLKKDKTAWRTWPTPARPTFPIPESAAGEKCINPLALSKTFQVGCDGATMQQQ
jgi:hypothetical protein